MKTKTTIRLFIIILSVIVFTSVTEAQSIYEDFDSVPALAASGWVIQNMSIPVGTSWAQGGNLFPAFSGTAHSFIEASRYNGVPYGNTISNWLIAPIRTINNGDTFSFYTRTVSFGSAPDRLEFRMSTNGASADVGANQFSVGDFTGLLLSVNPSLVVGGYPSGWTKYSVAISGLPFPTSGRVAFRYFITNCGDGESGNGSYIGIDDFVYTPHVCPPSLAVSDISLPNLNAGMTYYDSLILIDGYGTAGFAILSGSLPPGLTMNPNGLITGIPTDTGTYSFSVNGIDESGCGATTPETITISCAVPNVGLSDFPPLCNNQGSYTLFQGLPAGGIYSGTGVAGGLFTPSTPGLTTITYTYTDIYGCSNSATNELLVKSAPVANYEVDADTICAGDVITFTGYPLAADSLVWSNGVLDTVPFSPASTGGYLLTAYQNGCSDTISAIVAVNSLPLINPFSDIIVNNDAAQCAALVNFGSASASGGGTMVYTYSPAPGSSFPAGTNAVTITADNGCGSGTEIFNITVNDNEAPTITCPSDITVSENAGICFIPASSVALGTPSATDNCGTPTITNNASVNFYIGTNSITWTATDAHGNTATCTQNVFVESLPNSVNITICYGQSLTVSSSIYSSTGIYSDTLTSLGECDSIVTTNLTVSAAITGSQVFTLCAGDSVIVGNNSYSSTGTYTDVLTAAGGCDSVVTTNLTVNPAITASQTMTLCAGASVTVGTNSYSSTGTYTDVLTAAGGCDSVVTTNLTVNPAITASQTMTLCAGASVTVGTNSYSSTGTYTDVLTAAGGCDSVVTTNLTVSAAITTSQTMTLCAGASVTVGTNSYSSTGTYSDILTASGGCDSVVTTNLTVSPAITGSQTMTICAGASVTVGTNSYSSTGTYSDILAASGGCDSVVTTNLTVNAAITASQTMTICAGASITVGTNNYSSTGTYTDILAASNGCDSTVTTNLTVSAAITGSQTVTVCAGGSVTVGGNTYTSTGTYSDLYTASNGCDSTYITNLSVMSPITGNVTASLCTGGSVTVGTNTYNSTGIYTDTLTSFTSCDSIVTTSLTVASVISTTQTIVVCANGSVIVGSNVYIVSGTFTDTLTAIGGCDSVVTTNLTVLTGITGSQSVAICAGSSLVVGTSSYTITGIYSDTFTAFNGCDSVVTTHLTVNTIVAADAGASQTVCNGDTASLTGMGSGGILPYYYSWSNGTLADSARVSPSLTTTYFLTVTDSLGCSSAPASVIVNVIPGSDIYGQISSSSYGNIQFGVAFLFRWQPVYIHFDTVAISGLDAGGYYHFANVPNGNYLIEAFADGTIYSSPLTMPTYYDTSWNASPTIFWDSAFVLNTTCGGSDTFNIALKEQLVLAGSGHLSGRVTEGTNYRNMGDPISGSDVKLGHNPGGQNSVVVSTFTSPAIPSAVNGGYYDFRNVPDGCYSVYVDIPGLERDTLYTVCVNASTGDTTFTNLDYIADSSRVYIVPGSTVNAASLNQGETGFSVYPNPFSESATINYELLSDARVSLEVYTILGIRVESLMNANQKAGVYNYSFAPVKEMSAGAYFITLTIDGKRKTQRVLLIK